MVQDVFASKAVCGFCWLQLCSCCSSARFGDSCASACLESGMAWLTSCELCQQQSHQRAHQTTRHLCKHACCAAVEQGLLCRCKELQQHACHVHLLHGAVRKESWCIDVHTCLPSCMETLTKVAPCHAHQPRMPKWVEWCSAQSFSVPFVTLLHESACIQKSACHVDVVVGQIFQNAGA